MKIRCKPLNNMGASMRPQNALATRGNFLWLTLMGCSSDSYRHSPNKKYLDKRIATDDDPRRFGAALSENQSGLWKYHIGKHRLIAEIHEARVAILVARAGPGSKVYGCHRKNFFREILNIFSFKFHRVSFYSFQTFLSYGNTPHLLHEHILSAW